MTADFARRFAEEWIAAWNAHDLPRILSHYADDFQMSSPYIAEWLAEPTGTLDGKAAIGAYWTRGLAKLPNLHFTLEHTLAGPRSLTLVYTNAATGRRAAEVLFFNDALTEVTRAVAHYEI